ncbi:gypsy/ty3 retroelement polyprotein [Tanacetum coccineum]
MVNTRSNHGGNGDPNNGLSTFDLNNTLSVIQRSIDQINGNINGLLIFQQFATGELNKLTNGEGTSNRGGSGSQYGRLTMFEFPKFYREDVQRWLYIVNQFFLLDSIADDEKVRLVFMHMFNKALNWHKLIRKYGENVQWTVYEREEQFEALMNEVELSEAYAVSLFIAKMQEATLQVLKTKQTPLLSTHKTPYTNSYANRSMTYPPKTTTTALALPAQPAQPTLELIEAPLISLHALTGERTYNTMRVKAYVGKHTIHSLIDSGSTHTFLDLRVAKRLGCKLKATCPMDVSVANGQIMSSLYECKGFKWTLQGVEFTSDALILPLGGCEMVLGVQWLAIVGDIKWNFKDLVMDFVYNNKRMVLRGTQKATLQWMCGNRHLI